MKKFFLLVGLALLLTTTISTAELVISNSADWQDVYSSMIYAALNNYDNKFLVSLRHSEILIPLLDKEQKIIVVESDQKPYAKNYESRLDSLGFDVDTIKVGGGSRGNLYIANLLKDVKNFIVVDPTYGYSAVSVAPYAYLSKSFVLFADKDSIDSVASFLKSRKPSKLLLYGDLDKEVYEKLSQFSPEVINNGNRFKDNIAIAEKYRVSMNPKQAVLTNGEFLENEIIFSGKFKEPVIFVGKSNVPDYVIDYIKNAGYSVGVLIGNDLLPSGQMVKDKAGIKLFVKFGKGVAQQDSPYAPVEGLDIFPLPRVDLDLAFVSLKYNKATKQLELVLKNNKDVKTYLKPSLGIIVNGKLIKTVGSDSAELIGKSETKGFVFDVDLSKYVNDKIDVDVFVPFGAYRDALEFALTLKVPLQMIEVKDSCVMDITDLKYIKSIQRFVVTVKSNKACFADAMLIDLIVDDEPITVEMPGVERVNAGLSDLRIKQRMNDVDLADNPKVRTRVNYGSREDVLVKSVEKVMPLRVFKTENEVTAPEGGFLSGVMSNKLTVPILLLLILLLLLLLLWRRGKKRRH